MERGYHAIREAIRERISEREWIPGAVMPGEADFAIEYDCSRATVNRALQSLAEEGIIERKRRAGTRVKEIPVRRAKFEIPIIRLEVEGKGLSYKPKLITRQRTAAPAEIVEKLLLNNGTLALHLETIHLADARPYAFEDRWVNLEAAPEILNAPLKAISANEWLVRHAPYSSGDVRFSAAHADARDAKLLAAPEGAALFCIERMTWLGDEYITHARLKYAPGYEMRANL